MDYALVNSVGSSGKRKEPGSRADAEEHRGVERSCPDEEDSIKTVGSSSSGRRKEADSGERHDVESSISSDEEEDAPDEVLVRVNAVACKAGTTLFEAPLLP